MTAYLLTPYRFPCTIDPIEKNQVNAIPNLEDEDTDVVFNRLLIPEAGILLYWTEEQLGYHKVGDMLIDDDTILETFEFEDRVMSDVMDFVSCHINTLIAMKMFAKAAENKKDPHKK